MPRRSEKKLRYVEDDSCYELSLFPSFFSPFLRSFLPPGTLRDSEIPEGFSSVIKVLINPA